MPRPADATVPVVVAAEPLLQYAFQTAPFDELPAMTTTADAVHVTAKDPIHVRSSELQGHGVVFCPNPTMEQWSTHPRVYLDVAKTGEATCPYCGTKYVLDGPVPHGH